MPSLKITVLGVAATQRPRISAGGRGMYNVLGVKRWKDAVKEAAFLAKMKRPDLAMPSAGVPVRADYNFYLPWQKSTPKKKAATNGEHAQKPDLKNLLSHTEDALTDAGMWSDDAQVDTIAMQKWRCPRGSERVEVVISW